MKTWSSDLALQLISPFCCIAMRITNLDMIANCHCHSECCLYKFKCEQTRHFTKICRSVSTAYCRLGRVYQPVVFALCIYMNWGIHTSHLSWPLLCQLIRSSLLARIIVLYSAWLINCILCFNVMTITLLLQYTLIHTASYGVNTLA